MGSTMHAHGSHAECQGVPFDMGYRQDHHLLLARAGSDPTLGYASMSCKLQHILVGTAATPAVLSRLLHMPG